MNRDAAIPIETLALSPSTSPRYAVRSAWLVAAATLLRAGFATNLGLTDTEACYAAWARFPAASYYDHPPMIAWLIRATTAFGATAATTRLGPLLCSVAFAALLYRFTERLFSARAGFFAVVIATSLPVVTATGFIANPEAPLLPLWTLVLWVAYVLRVCGARWRPIALGAAIGSAFLCKFTGLLAAPVALLIVASGGVSPGRVRAGDG